MLNNIGSKEELLWYLWKESSSFFQTFEQREGFVVTRKDTIEYREELRQLIKKMFNYDVHESNGSKEMIRLKMIKHRFDLKRSGRGR